MLTSDLTAFLKGDKPENIRDRIRFWPGLDNCRGWSGGAVVFCKFFVSFDIFRLTVINERAHGIQHSLSFIETASRGNPNEENTSLKTIHFLPKGETSSLFSLALNSPTLGDLTGRHFKHVQHVNTLECFVLMLFPFPLSRLSKLVISLKIGLFAITFSI